MGRAEVQEVGHPGRRDEEARRRKMLREPERAEERKEQVGSLANRETERMPEGAPLSVAEGRLDGGQRRRPGREARNQAGGDEQADVHPRLAQRLLPPGDFTRDRFRTGHAVVFPGGESALQIEDALPALGESGIGGLGFAIRKLIERLI